MGCGGETTKQKKKQRTTAKNKNTVNVTKIKRRTTRARQGRRKRNRAGATGDRTPALLVANETRCHCATAPYTDDLDSNTLPQVYCLYTSHYYRCVRFHRDIPYDKHKQASEELAMWTVISESLVKNVVSHLRHLLTDNRKLNEAAAFPFVVLFPFSVFGQDCRGSKGCDRMRWMTNRVGTSCTSGWLHMVCWFCCTFCLLLLHSRQGVKVDLSFS